MDKRTKAIKRQIILDIDDYTPISFGNKDLEDIGANIEDLLRQNYDLIITKIDVKDVKENG